LKTIIPNEIQERLRFFEDEVKKYFLFLSEDYNYSLDTIETGRRTLLLDYYCDLIFKNGSSIINISYSTDILNGSLTAFPAVKQRPGIDTLISCNISDISAYMNVSEFALTTQPALNSNLFSIAPDTENITGAISSILINYSNFFKNNLVEVLKKQKIYSCYINRFDEKVFEEKSYPQ
jgi:hypothetical protein